MEVRYRDLLVSIFFDIDQDDRHAPLSGREESSLDQYVPRFNFHDDTCVRVYFGTSDISVAIFPKFVALSDVADPEGTISVIPSILHLSAPIVPNKIIVHRTEGCYTTSLHSLNSNWFRHLELIRSDFDKRITNNVALSLLQRPR